MLRADKFSWLKNDQTALALRWFVALPLLKSPTSFCVTQLAALHSLSTLGGLYQHFHSGMRDVHGPTSQPTSASDLQLLWHLLLSRKKKPGSRAWRLSG